MPNGSLGLGWIDADFGRLEAFDTIYLCFDMDEAGQKAVPEVAKRLGYHRCRIVQLPRKDLNQCLQDGIEGIEIENCFKAAQTLDPTELRPASAFVDQVIEFFYPADGHERGISTPWAKLAGKFLFRPGDLTILNAINGHGKSQLVGQLTLEAMRQKARCCVASMEMKPARWLTRLTRQAAGFRNPPVEYIRAIHEWYQDKLWVFDTVGTAKAQRILEVFEYAQSRYGIEFFVIDNLAKTGIREDDYNAQKDFVDALGDFAKDRECHISLVTHPRKGEGEGSVPGKMDVKGTGSITDMAENVISLWRDMEWENDHPQPGTEPKGNAVLKVRKQRHGEWEGGLNLFFDRESFQFLCGAAERPRSYVSFSKSVGALA